MLLYIAFILITVVLLSWLIYQQFENRAARRNSIKAVAEKIGFAFSENDAGFLRLIRKSQYLSNRYSVRACCCLSKSNEDVEIKVGDCRFSKDGSPCIVTICAVIDYGMNLPTFFVSRQTSSNPVIDMLFEVQDINFEEDQHFSDAFLLQGEDEISLKYLFSPEVRKYLMRYAGSYTQIEGAGTSLFLHKGRLEFPSDFETLARDTLDLYRLLKKTAEKEEL